MPREQDSGTRYASVFSTLASGTLEGVSVGQWALLLFDSYAFMICTVLIRSFPLLLSFRFLRCLRHTWAEVKANPVTFQTVGLVDALLRYFTAKGPRTPCGTTSRRYSTYSTHFQGVHTPLIKSHPRSSIAALDPSTTKSLHSATSCLFILLSHPEHSLQTTIPLLLFTSPAQSFFLDLYVRLVLSSREKPPAVANEAFAPLLASISRDTFQSSVFPSAVKMLRRNPELIMGATGQLFTVTTFDLSPFCLEFLPPLLAQARHQTP